jgi:hypothetical protein
MKTKKIRMRNEDKWSTNYKINYLHEEIMKRYKFRKLFAAVQTCPIPSQDLDIKVLFSLAAGDTCNPQEDVDGE